MINKYGIISLSAMVLFAIGCDDSSNSASASTVSADINEEAKIIIIKTPTCENISETEVMYNSEGEIDTLQYDVGNDTLILINSDYDTTYFTGNNSSIYGQWGEVDDEYCSQYNICEFLNITSSSIKRDYDYSKACPFDLLIQEYQGAFMNDGVTVTKKDCYSGSIDMVVITLNIEVLSFSSEKTEFVLSSGSKNCKNSQIRKSLTKSLCTVENIEDIEDGYFYETNEEEFDQCMETMLSNDIFNTIVEKKGSFSKLFNLKK